MIAVEMAAPSIAAFHGPFLIFLGDETVSRFAKTGFGMMDWRRDDCLGQLRLTSSTIDLGLPDMTIEQARLAGARSLILGTAAIGGDLKPGWIDVIKAALQAGMDVISGLHTRLSDNPVLLEAAKAHGGRIVDVRVPPPNLPVGTGQKRSGKRLLTVGTDCAVGKKYTALSLWKGYLARGGDCHFRATGQTGIMIAGGGIPIDAVVCDFTSGAAEALSPAAAPDHWDFIEGQGSLFHPGFAGVSLGLLHGSQPDAIIVCHDAAREWISEDAGIRLPSIQDCIARNLEAARLTNPDVRCIGVSVNTSALSSSARAEYLERLAGETGLPCIDPIASGVEPVLDLLEATFGAAGPASCND